MKEGETSIATYMYDALGRRVEKDDGTDVWRFVYSGAETVCVYDGSNGWLQDFVFGDGIDEVLMLQQADVLDFDDDQNTSETTRSFYHRNALGSVMAITEMDEDVAVEYRYDPYGAVTITRNSQEESADPLGNPWMYTGRFSDEETGLYYYRARYYSPEMGRFLQRDPLGYAPGPNLFRYSRNRPSVLRDPSGTTELPEPTMPGPSEASDDVENYLKGLAEDTNGGLDPVEGLGPPTTSAVAPAPPTTSTGQVTLASLKSATCQKYGFYIGVNGPSQYVFLQFVKMTIEYEDPVTGDRTTATSNGKDKRVDKWVYDNRHKGYPSAKKKNGPAYPNQGHSGGLGFMMDGVGYENATAASESHLAKLALKEFSGLVEGGFPSGVRKFWVTWDLETWVIDVPHTRIVGYYKTTVEMTVDLDGDPPFSFKSDGPTKQPLPMGGRKVGK